MYPWIKCNKNKESLAEPIGDEEVRLKENPRWNIATYHLRRAVGFQSPREVMWIETVVALSKRKPMYEGAANSRAKKNRAYRIEIPRDNLNYTLWDAFNLQNKERKYPFKNVIFVRDIDEDDTLDSEEERWITLNHLYNRRRLL
jgi:hypothetical protein